MSPQPPIGEILAIKQLAEYLMVSERTIYRMLDRGLLPAVRVGTQWRFRKRDIDTWLDEQVRRVEAGGQPEALPELQQAGLDLHPLLARENVWLDVPAQPRDALLAFLVREATLDGDVDRDALAESIRARELVCSTALVKDAAFPHPNEPEAFRFPRKQILLAVAREPIDFHDPHGHRPRVVVVILARTVRGYLLAISRAVKLFGAPSLIARLVKCGDPDDVLGALRDAEERLTAVAR